MNHGQAATMAPHPTFRGLLSWSVDIVHPWAQAVAQAPLRSSCGCPVRRPDWGWAGVLSVGC